MLVNNPLVWLLRFRHRRGYGVHSPFAYRFITEVVYERELFYAYEELMATLPFHLRFRVRKGLELMLRIANYRQPRLIVMADANEHAERYLRRGCQTAEVRRWEGRDNQPIDLCYTKHACDEILPLMGDRGILVVDNLHRCRRWFRGLDTAVRFDLYDIGIAFFGIPNHKCTYVVNF